MLAKEQEYICATVSIRVVERSHVNEDGLFQPQQNESKQYSEAEQGSLLFEHAGNVPASFAERHPLVVIGAVAASLVLAAIATEIECLHAMGYYWK